MSQNLDSIFQRYCAYTIEESATGARLCVFRNPAARAVYYSGGGFACAGANGPLVHDAASLARFLEYRSAAARTVPEAYAVWAEALKALQAPASAQSARRLRAG